VTAGRSAIVPRQAGVDQKVNQTPCTSPISLVKKTATRLYDFHRQLVVEFLVDHNNINREIHECIFALIRRGILGCAALLSYFMGSMREDRNQSPFPHFPYISPPQTKPLSRCPITPISNKKGFRGESEDSEFWGIIANKCFCCGRETPQARNPHKTHETKGLKTHN